MQYFGALQRGTRKINLYRLKDADRAPAGEFRQNHKNRVCKSGADLEAWLWKNLFDF